MCVFDRRSYHKEHLFLVVVWQEEESCGRLVGYLVVKGLAMELEEGGVGLDGVATPRVREGGGEREMREPQWERGGTWE